MQQQEQQDRKGAAPETSTCAGKECSAAAVLVLLCRSKLARAVKAVDLTRSDLTWLSMCTRAAAIPSEDSSVARVLCVCRMFSTLLRA